MRTFLAFVLAFWLVPVFAQSSGWNTMRATQTAQTGARAVTVTAAEMTSALIQGSYVPKSQSLLDSLLVGRTYIPKSGEPGAGTVIDGLRTGVGPTPAGVPYRASRAITWAATAKAASRALPLVGTALVVKDLFDDLRCRESFGGGPECDEGQPEVSQEVRCGVVPAISGLFGGSNWPGDERCAAGASQWASAVAALYASSGRSPFVVSSGVMSNGHYTVTLDVIVYSDGGRSTVSHATGRTDVSLVCPSLGPAVVPRIGKGPDGRCPTGEYEDVDYRDVEDKIREYGDKTKAPVLWPILDAAGIPIDHPSPTLSGPSAIQGGRDTTTRPDGSTTTRDTDHPMEYGPDGYNWRDRVTEREWGPGVVPDPVGSDPGSGTPPGTVTEGGSSPTPLEVITCGLPGKPPCKIDESGTPTEALPDPAASVAGATAAILACIASPSSCFPSFPTLSWDFALPTGCGVIDLPAFAPYLSGVDICPYQPMFHELMSVVWMLGGLFGAISMFWRKTFAA